MSYQSPSNVLLCLRYKLKDTIRKKKTKKLYTNKMCSDNLIAVALAIFA